MFKRASEILGYDLLQVCVDGPKEKLDSTAVRAAASVAPRAAARRDLSRRAAPARARQVSQPAIYVSSLAAVEKLKARATPAAPLRATQSHSQSRALRSLRRRRDATPPNRRAAPTASDADVSERR